MSVQKYPESQSDTASTGNPNVANTAPPHQISKLWASLSFRQDEHAENVLRRMQEYMESRKFCDVILVAGNDGRRVSAHRLILAATSEYFANLFMSSEQQQQEISTVNGENESELEEEISTIELAAEDSGQNNELPEEEEVTLVGLLRRKGTDNEEYVTMKGLMQISGKKQDTSEFTLRGVLNHGCASVAEMEAAEEIKCTKDFYNRECKKLEAQDCAHLESDGYFHMQPVFVSEEIDTRVVRSIDALCLEAKLESDAKAQLLPSEREEQWELLRSGRAKHKVSFQLDTTQSLPSLDLSIADEQREDKHMCQKGNLQTIEAKSCECQTERRSWAKKCVEMFDAVTSMNHETSNLRQNTTKKVDVFTAQNDHHAEMNCWKCIYLHDRLKGGGGDGKNQARNPVTANSVLPPPRTENQQALVLKRKDLRKLREISQEAEFKLQQNDKPLRLSLKYECKDKEISLSGTLADDTQNDYKITRLGGKLLQEQGAKNEDITVPEALGNQEVLADIKQTPRLEAGRCVEQKTKAKGKDPTSTTSNKNVFLTLHSMTNWFHNDSSDKDAQISPTPQKHNVLPSSELTHECRQRMSKENFKKILEVWKREHLRDDVKGLAKPVAKKEHRFGGYLRRKLERKQKSAALPEVTQPEGKVRFLTCCDLDAGRNESKLAKIKDGLCRHEDSHTKHDENGGINLGAQKSMLQQQRSLEIKHFSKRSERNQDDILLNSISKEAEQRNVKGAIDKSQPQWNAFRRWRCVHDLSETQQYSQYSVLPPDLDQLDLSRKPIQNITQRSPDNRTLKELFHDIINGVGPERTKGAKEALMDTSSMLDSFLRESLEGHTAALCDDIQIQEKFNAKSCTGLTKDEINVNIPIPEEEKQPKKQQVSENVKVNCSLGVAEAISEVVMPPEQLLSIQKSQVSQDSQVSQQSPARQDHQVSQRSRVSQDKQVSQHSRMRQDGQVSQRSPMSQRTQIEIEPSQKSEVSQDSQVSQHSPARQDGQVSQRSPVSQDSQVSQQSRVRQDGQVSQRIPVSQDSQVSQHSRVRQDGQVSQRSPVRQDSQVSQHSRVRQDGQVSQRSRVSQDSQASQHSRVRQDGQVSQRSQVSQDHQVSRHSPTSQRTQMEINPATLVERETIVTPEILDPEYSLDEDEAIAALVVPQESPLPSQAQLEQTEATADWKSVVAAPSLEVTTKTEIPQREVREERNFLGKSQRSSKKPTVFDPTKYWNTPHDTFTTRTTAGQHYKPKEFLLQSINGPTLQLLVNYCYTGSIAFQEEDTAKNVLATAVQFKLNGIVRECTNLLARKLHPSNCLGIINFAQVLNYQRLFEEAKDFASRHFLEACKYREFFQLTANQLSQILASDELNTSCEEQVFNIIMSWVQYNREERFTQLPTLLPQLRLLLMQPAFLLQHVEPVCAATTPECHRLAIEAIKWHLLPTIDRQSLPNKLTLKPRQPKTQWQLGTEKLLTIGYNISEKTLTLESYSPRNNKWNIEKRKRLLPGRKGYGVALVENELLIIGGYEDWEGSKALNSVLSLNLASLDWTVLQPLSECRYGTAVAVLGGFVYVAGGGNYYRTEFLNSVERWDSETYTWSYAAPMTAKRLCAGAVVLDGLLYVVGGSNESEFLSSMECYDPFRDAWTFKASMSQPRSECGVAAAHGYIYVVGGLLNGQRSSIVERYNPILNKWTQVCSLDAARSCCGCAALGNRLLAIGGYDTMGVSLSSVEEYNINIDSWESFPSLTSSYFSIFVMSVQSPALKTEDSYKNGFKEKKTKKSNKSRHSVVKV